MDRQQQLPLICPTCRQLTPILANGVAGLQSAFHINHFLEMAREVKKAMSSAGKVERDSTSLTPHDKVKLLCPEHGGITNVVSGVASITATITEN